MKILISLVWLSCLSSVGFTQYQSRKELPTIADRVVEVGRELLASDKQRRHLLGSGDENWIPFNGPTGCTGAVFVLERTYERDQWKRASGYIGGAFDSLDGKQVRGIAKINEFEEHQEIGGGVAGGAVYAIYDDSSNLFVAGNFKQAGGVAVNNIARWDGNQWHALGSGTDSTVLALCVLNGKLYAGGNFTHAGGVEANYIAVYDIAKDTWEPVVDNGVNGMNGGVAALTTDGTTLFAGGGFTKAGDLVAQKLAGYFFGEWVDLGAVEGPNAFVATMKYNEGLHIGGWFSKVGSIDANNIAVLRNNVWSQVGQGVDGPVYCVDPNFYGGNPYVICGEFQNAGAIEVNNVAYTYGEGSAFREWGSGLTGTAYAVMGNTHVWVAFQSHYNMVFVGGAFTEAGGKSSPNFAIHYEPSKGVEESEAKLTTLTLAPTHIGSGTATVDLFFADAQAISLHLVDALGREVLTLAHDQMVSTGKYTIDGSSLPTGLYYCVLQAAGKKEMKKLIVNH